MDRTSVVFSAGLIAAAIAFGFWYQNYNSPFERCVRALKADPSYAGLENNPKVEMQAVKDCTAIVPAASR